MLECTTIKCGVEPFCLYSKWNWLPGFTAGDFSDATHDTLAQSLPTVMLIMTGRSGTASKRNSSLYSPVIKAQLLMPSQNMYRITAFIL